MFGRRSFHRKAARCRLQRSVIGLFDSVDGLGDVSGLGGRKVVGNFKGASLNNLSGTGSRTCEEDRKGRLSIANHHRLGCHAQLTIVSSTVTTLSPPLQRESLISQTRNMNRVIRSC